MALPRTTRRASQSGFSLLEMLFSLSLLLILSGAILGGMGNMQKNYRGDEIRNVLHAQMRATLEMMEQEIGQAGLPTSGIEGNAVYGGSGAAGPVGSVTQSVTASTTAQSPSITNALVQTGVNVIVDTGANAEVVNIQNTSGGNPPTQITAVFQKAHTAPFNLYPLGVYPNGIAFTNPPTVSSTTPITLSYQSVIVFGDISGTGKLSVVQYSCPTAANAGPADSNGVQWGPLVRTEYDYVGGTWTSPGPTNMLDMVRVKTTSYPTAADGCRFDFNVNVPPVVSWYMVTSVNVTLVAESSRNDPTTNAPVVITKSFMNIQPRNIVNALNLYNYNNSLVPVPGDVYAEFNSEPSAVQTQIGSLTQ